MLFCVLRRFGRLVLSDVIRPTITRADADFAPVPRRGLLDDSDVGARGAAIMPGTRIDPNPLPGDPRPHEVAGLHSGMRLAVAEPVTGPGETTTHFCDAGDELLARR